MSREKIAKQIINHLEERINCSNVIKFAEKTIKGRLGSGKEAEIDKLDVIGIPVAFKIMNYNDQQDYVRKEKNDTKDRIWVNNMFNTFDFMTEANYTGFEYFPYLYGVLNCHEQENSKIYIFYEVFDGSLIDLIKQIEHPSEWYDIVFQMIMINYYIQVINGYRYNDGTPQNHLYRKLDKPYYKEYEINDLKLNINHKYLIVLWDINYMETITNQNINQTVSNISFLLKYLNDNKDIIKIPPSSRIMKLLYNIKDAPNDIAPILQQYYGQTAN